MSDKTEEATPTRLRKAQESGDSPLSSFASQAIAFVFALAIVPTAISSLATHTNGDLRTAIARAADPFPAVTTDPAALASAVVFLSMPILVVTALTGAVASLLQTGGVVATKRLAPDLGKLDPIQGFRQLFSTQRLVAIVRATVFAAAVVWTVLGALRTNATLFARTTGRVDAAIELAGSLARDVAKRAAIVGLFLAAADVIVTRRSWKKRLMMTKAEVKREHKESDGDPEMKAARGRAQQEMLASATVANVRKATVVIVNPTHIACALRYDASDGAEHPDEAPVLVASGHGELAKRIIDAARDYGVPVLRDVPLARALVELEVGDPIPEALYETVAEILRAAWDETHST